MGFALGVNDDNRIIVTSVSEFVQQHTSIRPGNQVRIYTSILRSAFFGNGYV
eukprot:SAG31_NODE_3411_length_4305_cov_2.870185_7_plen_52_part_00